MVGKWRDNIANINNMNVINSKYNITYIHIVNIGNIIANITIIKYCIAKARSLCAVSAWVKLERSTVVPALHPHHTTVICHTGHSVDRRILRPRSANSYGRLQAYISCCCAARIFRSHKSCFRSLIAATLAENGFFLTARV